jgi:hypothetical protein
MCLYAIIIIDTLKDESSLIKECCLNNIGKSTITLANEILKTLA